MRVIDVPLRWVRWHHKESVLHSSSRVFLVLNRCSSLALGLKLSRLAPDGVDDLIHTGHPCHAGKDNVHAGVVLLHRTGGAAVPHHDTVVILVSSIPQAAFDHTGGGVSGEEQRGDPKAAQVDSQIRGVEWAGGVLGDDHILRAWCQLCDDSRTLRALDETRGPTAAWWRAQRWTGRIFQVRTPSHAHVDDGHPNRARLGQKFLAVGNERCPTQRHNWPVALDEFVLEILEQ